MKKNRRYILLIVILVLIFGTSYYSMNKQQKGQDNNQQDTAVATKDNNQQDTALTEAEIQKIPLTRKEYRLNFDKTTTSFTSEAVDVFKDKTEKKLSLIFDENAKDKVSIKIYQDDKLLKEIKRNSDLSYTIPFEMNNDKSTFKIEINCLAPLGDNEKLITKVIWYVNKRV